MWWDGQNLDSPRQLKDGRSLHFRVWHAVVDSRHIARVFFWDDDRKETGVALLQPGNRTDVAALKALIEKIAADAGLRSSYARGLRFPLERHYSEYGRCSTVDRGTE
jgi:hypothetical protein